MLAGSADSYEYKHPGQGLAGCRFSCTLLRSLPPFVMAPSYGAFVPEDTEDDGTSPHTPLVVSDLPSVGQPPRYNDEAATTHRRGLAKVGGLILFATAATAVFMGGSGSDQADPVSGGTSAVIATGLKHQQTSGVTYSGSGDTFLDAATGTVMEVEPGSSAEPGGSTITDLAAALDNGGKGHSGDWVNSHGDGASPKLWPDSDNFDPTSGQRSNTKSGDGSGTSHSSEYENQEEEEEEEEEKEEEEEEKEEVRARACAYACARAALGLETF